MSKIVEKTGWVHELCIEVTDVEQTPYLRVTISPADRKPRLGEELATFILIRHLPVALTDNLGISFTPDSSTPSISYSNASMAAIALLKDAFWQRRRVTIRGDADPKGPPGGVSDPLLLSVCVSTDYLHEETLGDQPDRATGVAPSDVTIGKQPEGPDPGKASG